MHPIYYWNNGTNKSRKSGPMYTTINKKRCRLWFKDSFNQEMR